MQYELLIEKGKEEPVISFLKSLDFVTVRKRQSDAKKASGKKEFTYFGALPEWNVEAADLRRNKARKNKTAW